MKFIGNLFLRKLIYMKVISQIAQDLIGIHDDWSLPAEHMIDCMCELLQTIGHTLDGMERGNRLMQRIVKHMQVLMQLKDQNGKLFFPKRTQFQIENILELRSNDWQKKVFKEQATTKDQVRGSLRAHNSKCTDVGFTTQIAGIKPSYILEFEPAKPMPSHAIVEELSSSVWDQAYVKKIFQYFHEERNGHSLQVDWLKAQPSVAQSAQGINWLCEIGFDNCQKEDVVAECIVELLHRQAITWDILSDILQPYLHSLEDLKLDIPNADSFIHSIFAKLLLAITVEFKWNPILLKQLPFGTESGNLLCWNLLCGMLSKAKSQSGPEGFQRALDAEGVSDSLCQAKGCSLGELESLLQQEIN